MQITWAEQMAILMFAEKYRNPAIGGTFLCLLMPVPSPDKWRELQQEGHLAQKFFCQNRQMRNHHQSIPDRSRPRLPTTTSGVAQQGTCGNYATAKLSENKSRKRGGKRVKKQREAWKGRCSLIRVGTLNIGTMTGRGRELADMMERKNVDVLCLQETKWKGSKARNIGGGCKIFYNRADGRKNGIGIVLR